MSQMPRDRDPEPAGPTKAVPTETAIKGKPLFDEMWREYDFGGRVYRIEHPAELFMRDGGTTHRVVDTIGVVHCVPAPGYHGCVLRWMVKAGHPNVAF